MRFLSFLALVAWVALAVVPAWYASNSREHVSIKAELGAAKLGLHTRTDESFHISPASAIGLRVVGMRIGGRGFEGFIVAGSRRVSIAPATDFIFTPSNSPRTAYVDFRTTDPLTIDVRSSSTESPKRVLIQVTPGAIFGRDLGLGVHTVRTAEYLVAADSSDVEGTFHATSLVIWRAHGMSFHGEGLREIHLASLSGRQARSGPISFYGQGGQGGKLRVFLNPSDPLTSQGFRASVDRLSAYASTGKMVAGVHGISLTGLEDIKLIGQMKVDSVDMKGNSVRVFVSGIMSRGTMGGEYFVPSKLENLVAKPFWTIFFGLTLVIWSSVIALLLKFGLTGKWGGD